MRKLIREELRRASLGLRPAGGRTPPAPHLQTHPTGRNGPPRRVRQVACRTCSRPPPSKRRPTDALPRTMNLKIPMAMPHGMFRQPMAATTKQAALWLRL